RHRIRDHPRCPRKASTYALRQGVQPRAPGACHWRHHRALPAAHHREERDRSAVRYLLGRAQDRRGLRSRGVGEEKPVRPWGRGSDRLLRTLGGAPGEKIRSALLGRNKAHFSLVTSVKTERSRNRGMHNPSAANIESGTQVLVLIKRRETFVRELDHKGQSCIVERL